MKTLVTLVKKMKMSDNQEKISCDEAEDNSDSDNEPEPANNIPIVIGLRSPPIIPPLSQLNFQKRVQIGDRQKLSQSFWIPVNPPPFWTMSKRKKLFSRDGFPK